MYALYGLGLGLLQYRHLPALCICPPKHAFVRHFIDSFYYCDVYGSVHTLLVAP